MAGVLVFDERLNNFRFTKPAPWQREASDQLTNSDPGAACTWVSKLIGVGFSAAQTMEALVACKPKVLNYDPVAHYLKHVAWDGVPRIDTWLVDYAGCEDGEWARAIGRKTLVAAVARALRPGCKADTVLVLEGPQGRQKSSLIKALCADESWFSEYDGALSGKDKDAVQSIASGPWLVEIGELSSLSRSEVNVVKQFVSRAVDRFRPPYGRVTERFPRKTVFFASTNESEYLQDRTGNRRWWPIEAGECDHVGASLVRDQLWAEAVAAFNAGEQWWLNKAQEEIARGQQDQRLQSDPWDEELAGFLDARQTALTVREMMQALGLPMTNANSREVRRLQGVLRAAGWRQGIKERGPKGITRYWHPPNRVLTFEDAARIVASGDI
jgi:putative DNA primase/helicase